MSRNVEALNRLTEDWARTISEPTAARPLPLLAEWLAARGVLAVDSLTDEQAEDVWECAAREEWGGTAEEGDAFMGFSFRSPEDVRAALRRCATGEAE